IKTTFKIKNMKNFKSWAKIIAIVIGIVSCSDGVDGNIPPVSDTQIIAFQFLAADNIALTEDIIGVINESKKTITAIVPDSTDVTALLPQIAVPLDAIITPTGIQDFSVPVLYTVTAEDGTTAIYTVTTKISDRDILIALYNANPENTLGWDITTPDTSTWDGVITNGEGNVIELNLTGKNISILPAKMGQLAQLSLLNLLNNNLSSIPAEMGKLSNLTYLNLGSNNLSSLPVEIWQLNQLKDLTIYNNDFSTIPAEIIQLKNLLTLSLSNNPIPSLPDELWQLTQLESLSLSTTSLTSVPDELSQLVNLTYLSLDNNNLSSVPIEEIGQLSKLTYLNLGHCELTHI